MAIRPQSANHARQQYDTNFDDAGGSSPTVKPIRPRLSRWAKRMLAVGCLSAGLVGSTGCMMTSGVSRAITKSDCIDEFMIGYRNRALAEKAWHCEKHRFGGKLHLSAFKDGFTQGYIEVASGGNGCCPSVAPSRYWGWRYQSAHGQGAVNAWFEGYPLGVQAAEEDGLGHSQVIRTTGMMMGQAPLLAPTVPSHTAIPSHVEETEVANPFYAEPEFNVEPQQEPGPEFNSPEPEFIPQPELIEPGDAVPDEAGSGAFQIEESDSVFQPSLPEFPIVDAPANDQPELVKQSELAKSHEAAVSATLGDRVEDLDFPEPEEVVIDDLFGTPTTPVNTDAESEELPFTFE